MDKMIVKTQSLSWQLVLAWFVGLIGVATIIFVNTLSLKEMRQFFWPYTIPLVQICSFIVSLNTASRETITRRKIAWLLIAISSILNVVYVIIRWKSSYRTDAFFVAIFICTILGLVLYFPRNVWSIGNTARLILDIALLAFSAIALMQSVIYYFFGKTPAALSAASYVIWIGFEFAAFLQAIFLWQRYRQGILFLISLSAICVILADITGTARFFIPEMSQFWGLPDYSLYHIHYMVIMIFGYYSVDKIKDIDFDAKKPVSLLEWVIQLLTPKLFFFASFLVVCLVHLPDRWVIVAMGIAAVCQSVAAITEEGKLVQRLFAAMDTAGQSNARLAASNGQLVRTQHQLQLLLEQVEKLTLTQERARIARDIHDGVGQRLQAVRLTADELLDRVEAQYNGVIRAMITNIDRAQDNIRRAILALRDTSELSLEDSLIDPLEHCRLLNLKATLEVRGVSRRVSATIRHMLYHIALEAVTNIGRHAQARHVQLILDYTDPQSVVLTVADDGQGFSEQPRQPGQGNGVRNMRDRAEALGGECQVTSTAQGVIVWARIPTVSAF